MRTSDDPPRPDRVPARGAGRLGTGLLTAGLCVMIVATSYGVAVRPAGAGTSGASARAGLMLLRGVAVELSAGAVRRLGGDAVRRLGGDAVRRLGGDAVGRLAVFGEFGAEDDLVAVRSDHARAVELRWDRECDGVVEAVDRLPVVAGAVPGQSGERLAYHLALTGFTARSGREWTVPLVFEFRDAGTVRVDAPVRIRTAPDVPACPYAG
ncbi:hypothetical protein [Actinosynnema sp. NPDC023587]|uniref:hypothetical protein n=1 Tax=Actinosynnema sp. NPDC023587 TaxID=3154695 RepID=UPI0033C962F6